MSDLRRYWVVPPFVFLFFLLVLPFLELARVGLLEGGSFSAGASSQFINPLYRSVFLNTVLISSAVTALCVFLGLPTVYFILHQNEKKRHALIVFTTASMWLSVLVRNYAWVLILQRKGLASQVLFFFGLLEAPRSFLFSRCTVIIGMTHVLLPLMILVMSSSVGSRSRQMFQLAEVLGARPVLYFTQVFIPSVWKSGCSGALLIFLLGLGFLITPELLGGGKGSTMMMAVLIEEQINGLGNWSSGALLSFGLTAVVVSGLVTGWFLLNLGKIWKSPLL
jgi:putative spermidine/putrescine transport system permease protein